jgi:hypothetical protein
VTNVRWSRDDRFVVSLGGADKSVLVWKHHDQEGEQEDQSSDVAEDTPNYSRNR